jgi:hypothetical protein
VHRRTTLVTLELVDSVGEADLAPDHDETLATIADEVFALKS